LGNFVIRILVSQLNKFVPWLLLSNTVSTKLEVSTAFLFL